MRAAKRARLAGGVALTDTRFMHAGALADNPNRGKRGASPVGRALAVAADGQVFRPALSPDQVERSRAYTPLNVSHPVIGARGRHLKTRTSYTI